jgi:hypothetical protein
MMRDREILEMIQVIIEAMCWMWEITDIDTSPTIPWKSVIWFDEEDPLRYGSFTRTYSLLVVSMIANSKEKHIHRHVSTETPK